MKLLFKQQRKVYYLSRRKGVRLQKYPFGVAGQYVGPWFVGSVCKASSSVFFSEGFQVESVAVMRERSVSAAGSWLSDFVCYTKRD